MPEQMIPPGGAPDPTAAAAAGPKMPGNMAGGPSGPGNSPAMSPGAGAGNEAAADAMVKAVIPALHKAMSAYPVGSKKYSAMLNALRALTANFGKETQQPMVPAAILQMAQAAKSGGPMANAPPMPIAPSTPSGPPGGGAEA